MQYVFSILFLFLHKNFRFCETKNIFLSIYSILKKIDKKDKEYIFDVIENIRWLEHMYKLRFSYDNKSKSSWTYSSSMYMYSKEKIG